MGKPPPLDFKLRHYRTMAVRAGSRGMTKPRLHAMVPVLHVEREWWGLHLDEQAYINLVREIEIEKGKFSTHERECGLRYGQINETLDEIKRGIGWVLKTGVVMTISLIAYLALQIWPPSQVQAHQSAPFVADSR